MNDSSLQLSRRASPLTPPACLRGSFVSVAGEPTTAVGDHELIKGKFPHMYGQRSVQLVPGGDLKDEDRPAIRLGVVLSGGQAPGGHNVIAGLYDFVHTRTARGGVLLGFLGGPKGIFTGDYMEITAELLSKYEEDVYI
jgi:pyrophosphate--fructose-6-phosphate 1-phosphotransferase